MVATVQLLIAAAMLAAVAIPIFVWVLYSPYPERAYEVGAAWNILALFVGGGIVAAAVTSYAARGWVFSRSRDRAPFAAAVAGPVAVLLPALWLLGGVTGVPGLVYVVLISAFATLAFWLIIRRLSRSVPLAGTDVGGAVPEGEAGKD